MADTRKQIPLRLPPDLADAIDQDRPSTLSRNAWIEDACRRKLGPAYNTPIIRHDWRHHPTCRCPICKPEPGAA